MASICQIGSKWRALIRRKGHRHVSRYFATKREAEAWAREVETGIDKGHGVSLSGCLTVADLVAEFKKIKLETGSPVDPTSNASYMLDHLAEDLAGEQVMSITPDRLARWARVRREQGAGGYTINMELSQLGTAIRAVSAFRQIQIPDVVGQARPVLHYLQLISGGKKRSRRATDDELAAVLLWLDDRNPVVADAIRVASITGLRRGELCRLSWFDLDRKRKAVLVRQRKHPRRVEARDEWVPLLGESYGIVCRQTKVDGRIFPVSPETMTDNFTAATRALGIPDLHLHDMRRNATSRLRELGFDQHERKAITGHRSDEVHERYVDVTPESLHERYAAALNKRQRPKRPQKGRARQREST